MGLQRTVGYGGDSGSIADIEKAGLVLIVGCNPAENHPVLATRVKRSHKLRGQRLIVADLRKHEMAERADIFFRPNPSTDAVWMSPSQSTSSTTASPRWTSSTSGSTTSTNTRNRSSPSRWSTPSRSPAFPPPTPKPSPTRSPAADGTCILLAMGVTQHCGGSDTATAHLEPSPAHRQLHAPRRRSLSSARPQQRAGRQRLRLHAQRLLRLSASRRPRRFAPSSKPTGASPLPTTKGQTTTDDRRHPRRQAQGLYIKGEDTITSDSNANYVGRALAKLEFLVVQDINFSETCALRRPGPSRLRPRSKKKAPSPAPSAASSASTKRSSRSASRSPTGRSSSSSPTAWAPTGTTSIPPRSWTKSRSLTPTVRRRQLRAARRLSRSLQWPVSQTAPTRRCSSPRNSPSPTARQSSIPSNRSSPPRRRPPSTISTSTTAACWSTSSRAA